MEHIYDIIILGGGPAGYSAALYAARAGFDVVLIEKMSPGGQMALTGDIDNYPGFDEGVDGFTLGMKMQAGAERFGAKTEYATVTEVDFSEKIKKITTDNGEFYGNSVIIAFGADPRKLGIDGEDENVGNGVHYCAHCDGRFYKDKTVAVVGGGNSAAEDALYLSRLCKKVFLIHRRDTLRASRVYHAPLENTQNIEFIWNSEVCEIKAENGSFKGISVKNIASDEVSDIECDALFISIGRQPVTEIFKGKLPLDENGYIIADETTKTEISGVFAAGDIRQKALRQVVTAAADGAVAVHFAEEYLIKN